jgi:hypothetical protein
LKYHGEFTGSHYSSEEYMEEKVISKFKSNIEGRMTKVTLQPEKDLFSCGSTVWS